jgi:hypothetical protein
MYESSYTIFDWGQQTNGGRNVQYEIGVRALAKRSATNLYELANEMLCMRLGQALKLPVPPGVIVNYQQRPYYASLHVSANSQNLPPAIGPALNQILNDVWLTCGIICFDSWILNEDRRGANILIRKSTGEVYLIDHGSAFYDKDGRTFLESKRDDICIGPDHCLGTRVQSLFQFDEWHQRIRAIPEFFIRESVEQAVALGLPSCDVDYCANYLLERRDRLKDIFRAKRRDTLPKLDHGLFDPFDHDCPEYCI